MQEKPEKEGPAVLWRRKNNKLYTRERAIDEEMAARICTSDT